MVSLLALLWLCRLQLLGVLARPLGAVRPGSALLGPWDGIAACLVLLGGRLVRHPLRVVPLLLYGCGPCCVTPCACL